MWPFNLFVSRSTHEAVLAAYLGCESDNRSLRETNYALDRSAVKFKQERDALRIELEEAQFALSNICAMQTPNCADIGVKMAARARKALPDRCASSIRIVD